MADLGCQVTGLLLILYKMGLIKPHRGVERIHEIIYAKALLLFQKKDTI